jgi:predicted MFS family arabinose efflux permease
VLYGLFAAYGYFLYGFSPTVPLIRDEQHTSAAVSGLHGTALATGAVVAGVVGSAVVGRCGRRWTLWGSVAGLCAGVVLFCGPPMLPLTLAGALVAGTFGSALINTVSATLSDHHGRAASASISEANAAGSGIGILVPLIVGTAVSAGAGWRAGLLVILVFCAALAVAGFRVQIPEPAAASGSSPATAGARSLSSRYWWAWGVLVLCVALEFCLTIWCSDVLEQRAGLSAGVAATGVTAIVAGMTLGRVVGGRFALRHGAEWLLYRGLAVYLAGFTVFWTSTAGWLSFCGLFIAGLGLALLFPLSIARAIAFSDGRPDLATARVSLGAGLAVGVGPFLLGALTDAFGTHRAFLLVPVMAVAAAGGIRLGGAAARRAGEPISGEAAEPPR